MTVTIYHNPDCGTSRNTLALIRQSGEEPVVIEYPEAATIAREAGRAHCRDGDHPAPAAA